MLIKRLFLLTFALSSLTACLKTVESRGYTFEQANISAITPKKQKKEDVLQLLGSPTTLAHYGKETWYYIATKAEYVGFFKPDVVDQRVIAVTFNNDVVDNIREYTLKDGQPVPYISDTTPTEGHDVTVIQQLIGNVGRFNGDGLGPRTSPHSRPMP